MTISGNTIRDLAISNTNNAINYKSSAIGIVCNNNYKLGGSAMVANNTVYNISNNNAGFTGVVKGMDLSYVISQVSGNLIHGLSVNPASTGATLIGIYGQSDYKGYKNFNNIVYLGGNTATSIYGAYESWDPVDLYVNFSTFFYFNTIVINGNSPAGSLNRSCAFYNNTDTSKVRDFRNNLFVNARSTPGGASLHYAAYLD